MAGKADIKFKIGADDSELQRVLKTARTNLNSLGSAAIGGAAVAGLAAIAAGAYAVNSVVKESIKLANEQEKAEAKLTAVI